MIASKKQIEARKVNFIIFKLKSQEAYLKSLYLNTPVSFKHKKAYKDTVKRLFIHTKNLIQLTKHCR